MTQATVAPVTTRREQRQFLELPWGLYRDDPHWIPPLRGNQRELVGFASHPFYHQGQSQAFLALRDGRPIGRVLAIHHPAHNERHKEQRGFFGFFECEDDPSAATGLLNAARAWLAEKGLTDIRGPVNPSLNYECGLLVEGFDSSPFFMMTYNRPYYGRLIEGAGFQKVQDLYAYWGHLDMLYKLDKKLVTVVEGATSRLKLTTRRLDRSKFLSEVKMFLHLYNESLAGTWGFVPMSEAEVEHAAASLRRLIVPELTSVAEVDGRPIGCAFGLLDYNPLIKKIDGRLFPFGFLRLLTGRRKITRMRILTANVLPEYQLWGVGLVLLHRLIPDCVGWGMTEAEFSWVLESNNLSLKSLERGGAIRTKTYRLYDAAAK